MITQIGVTHTRGGGSLQKITNQHSLINTAKMSNKTPVLIAGLETQEASAADSVADLSEIYENMKRRKTLEGVMNPEKAPVAQAWRRI